MTLPSTLTSLFDVPMPTRRKQYAFDVPMLALWKLNNVFFTFSPTSLFDLMGCCLSGETSAGLCCSTKVVMMHLLSFVNLIATIARQPHRVIFFFTLPFPAAYRFRLCLIF